MACLISINLFGYIRQHKLFKVAEAISVDHFSLKKYRHEKIKERDYPSLSKN